MKKSAIIRIVIYSVLIVLLLALLGSAIAVHVGIGGFSGLLRMTGHELEGFDEELEEILEDREDGQYYMTAEQGKAISVAAADVTDIEVDWISGDVILEPGDVDSIELSETVTEHPMLYSVRNGKLTIRFRKNLHKPSWGKNMESKDLRIAVPRTWMGQDVKIQSVSADVTIRDLTLEEVEYQGVSGECFIENCVLGELSVQTVSGDVEVTGEIRELECEGVSADCELTVSNVPEKISLEGVSGELRLTLPENAGFTVELEGLSKDLDTDFPVISQNGKFIAGDGSCAIEIESVSGHARIRKAA